MDIRPARTPDEIDACYSVMAELRPHVGRDQFVERVQRQIESHGYALVALREGERVCAVAGFRISENLAWGVFLYVDDLVTLSSDRSSGRGGALLDWLTTHARENGCEQLHLDSGVQRFAAHRFYLRHRMDIASHHFSRILDG
jgi:GNAT superfamily N-acetyltransferase